MMERAKNWWRNTISGLREEPGDDTVGIEDPSVIEEFTSDPENTFLVSFPRTGSHWLRMLMELYFERPSLVRIFFYPEETDYLTLHTHDMDLDVERKRVIYLYREPVATIYSQMQYHGVALDDVDRIVHWSDLYGRHLAKWLGEESITEQKTLIRHDRLKTGRANEFAKVCTHFSVRFDADRFERVDEVVTKEKVNEKTRHNPRVIQKGEAYERKRDHFREEWGETVLETVFEDRAWLKEYF
jgi:hypothetical protein